MDKRILFLIIAVFIFCTGCSKPDDQQTEPSISLTYVSSDMFILSNERISAINSYFKENGFDLKLDFVFLGNDNYYDNLTNYIDSGGKADIIYSGWFDDPYWKLAENGYLEPLDSYFNSETGKALYGSIPELRWDSVEKDGLHYGINGYIHSGNYAPRYIVNKKIAEKYELTEDDLKKPIYELQEILLQINTEEKQAGFTTVIASPSSSFPSCFNVNDDVSIDLKTGAAEFFIDNSELQNWLKSYYELALQSGFSFSDTSQSNDFFIMIVEQTVPTETEEYSSQDFIAVDVDCYDNYTTKMGLATCISSNSTEKETAFTVISEIFSKRELTDIFQYGLAGDEFVDDGSYYLQDGKISKETTDTTNIMLYQLCYGNSFVSTPLYNEYSDKTERYFTFYKNNIKSSPFIGLPVPSNLMESSSVTYPLITNDMLESESFDGFIENVRSRLIENGVDNTVIEINRILGEYNQ